MEFKISLNSNEKAIKRARNKVNFLLLICRAGILYINPGDLGWNPYVTSWIETRENQVTDGNT